jgi:glucose/arabinose dehydrogenase
MICQEIFATGLRNPFRIAFDPNDTSDPQRFYITDVGQSSWEEIDDGQSDADYGWNVREGPCPTGTTTGCAPDSRFLEPVFAYDRSGGCVTITGGAFVPNDAGWPPEFNGRYLFADFGCGKIFTLLNENAGESALIFATGTAATSLRFGPDHALYYTTFDGGGEVHRIVFTP